MDQDHDHHVDKLLKLCRIYSEHGSETEGRKYRQEILVLHSVDVSEDMPSVAPTKFVEAAGKKLIAAKFLFSKGIIVIYLL